MRFRNAADLAARTSGILLASAVLEHALDKNAQLHPCLQVIATGDKELNWPEQTLTAAAMLTKQFGTYTVKPNSACDGLDFVTDSWNTWSPADVLLTYREDLEHGLTNELRFQPNPETIKRYRQKLREALVLEPMTTTEYLKLFLSPNALFALAYGGYYTVATGVARVEGLCLHHTGHPYDWEKLVNNLLAANEKANRESLNAITF